MKRNTFNLILDISLALCALAMIATGLVMRWVLPPGSGRSALLWGWNRHDWGDLHFWLAIAIVGIVVAHLAMHWQWVCVTFVRLCKPAGGGVPALTRRLLAGTGALVATVALLVGFLWVASDNVTAARAAEGGRGLRLGPAAHALNEDAPFLTGSMSLSDAAHAAGISTDEACKRLHLSASTSPDERLGRLCRQQGITMQDARTRLLAHQGS